MGPGDRRYNGPFWSQGRIVTSSLPCLGDGVDVIDVAACHHDNALHYAQSAEQQREADLTYAASMPDTNEGHLFGALVTLQDRFGKEEL